MQTSLEIKIVAVKLHKPLKYPILASFATTIMENIYKQLSIPNCSRACPRGFILAANHPETKLGCEFAHKPNRFKFKIGFIFGVSRDL